MIVHLLCINVVLEGVKRSKSGPVGPSSFHNLSWISEKCFLPSGTLYTPNYNYEPKGREFESLRAHHLFNHLRICRRTTRQDCPRNYPESVNDRPLQRHRHYVLIERFSCPTSNLLDAVSEDVRDKRITRVCIKHCVIEVALWPVQLKVSLNEGSAIFVNRVNVRYCLFLGYSSSDQSVDFKVARCVEERTENIFAFTKKILRASANDNAWAARQCMADRLFGNGGDSARIEQFQPIGRRQAPLECSSKKRLEHAINRRIIFPFPLLDRLRRAVGQPCDFLS